MSLSIYLQLVLSLLAPASNQTLQLPVQSLPLCLGLVERRYGHQVLTVTAATPKRGENRVHVRMTAPRGAELESNELSATCGLEGKEWQVPLRVQGKGKGELEICSTIEL